MGNSRKILIIDDDDELRDSLSEQLSLHEEFDTMLAANASDGLGASYGAHLDLLTTRDAFEDIFRQRSHYLAWLASPESKHVTGRVFEASGQVLAVAEGWVRGPRTKPIEDPTLLGPVVGSGFLATTLTVPAIETSVAGIAAMSWVELE